ncbi:MAG: glycosyltransferase family 2 protein [Opitutaceae bacterium]|nr:glycosyltransferase family 2 protein [Opitutaceae bacterium]
MSASIIICTYNRARDLDATLRALQATEVPADFPVDTLVVDNGSTDETRHVVEAHRGGRLGVSYTHEPRRGKGHAYNRGLAESRGEIAIFTDDDVRPARNWIAAISAPIRENRAEAVAGTITIAPHLDRPWMKTFHRTTMAATTGWDMRNPGGMNGANMAFTKRVLEKVPGFDPELGPGALGFWDEALFGNQLLAAGYRITGAAEAIVEHHFQPSRLKRQAFLEHAAKAGRSVAYLAWHWGHSPRDPFVRFRALRKRIKLALLRTLHPRDCTIEEGCAEWEFNAARTLAYFEQFAREQERPRAYAKHGLRKLAPAAPRSTTLQPATP